MASDYIMRSPAEPSRIRAKTSAVLLDHHLAWAGVGPGDSFVDFGCASGEVVRAAAVRSGTGRVLGVDADEEMLRFAAEESGRLGLGIEYMRADIAGEGSTGLPTGQFDHAWARWFLEYMPNPQAVVREMARVVAPGGRVTLIDLDGNGVWHHPTTPEFRAKVDEVMSDLAQTGFDPHAGARLAGYARGAGLVDTREQIEPYHWIVGSPDSAAAEAWNAKVNGLRTSYLTRIRPDRVDMAAFFDEFLAYIMDEATMTWSLAHLVQGTKPR